MHVHLPHRVRLFVGFLAPAFVAPMAAVVAVLGLLAGLLTLSVGAAAVASATEFRCANIVVSRVGDGGSALVGLNPHAVTNTGLDVTPVSPAAAGTGETLTVTVTPAAGGSVQFKDGAATLGDPVAVMAGTAVLPITLVPGSHSLTAVFTPTDVTAFRSSTSSPVNYVVHPVATNTTLHVLGFPFQGLSLALLAGVSPSNVAGTVQFKDGDIAIGAPVQVFGGTALLVTPAPEKGVHTLTEMFVPADPMTFVPSASTPVSVTIQQLRP